MGELERVRYHLCDGEERESREVREIYSRDGFL